MAERVDLGLRVPEPIKRSYEDEIIERRGVKRPYAGIRLEEELQVALGIGRESDLFDSLSDLVDKHERKKESETEHDQIQFSGGDTVVNYKIHEDVRAELMSQTQGTVTSAGSLVAAVMYSYATGNGYRDIMMEYIEELENDSNDELSATEKKERDIAEYLKEHHSFEDVDRGQFLSFDITDFEEAAKEAGGISTTDYAREKYLKPVLDRLDVIPTKSGNFLSEDSGPHPDPRGLPYDAMSNDEKKAIIKAKALEKGGKDTPGRVTVSEAKQALGGRPQKSTVRTLLEEIGDNWKFEYQERARRFDEPHVKQQAPIDRYSDRVIKLAGYDIEEVHDGGGATEESPAD